MQMYQQMTWVAKAVAFVLLIMSMWSIGVAIERIFTFTQARNQSKLYAPQVAKHLKELPADLHNAFLGPLVSAAAQDDPPFTLDYQRLNISARKPA